MLLPENMAHINWPRAIIWDLDGTLIDSAQDIATALNIVLEAQGQCGHTVPMVRTMIGNGVANLIERAFRGTRVELDSAAAEALVPRFMEIYTSCATETTRLSPAGRYVLKHFYDAGVHQGMCTNKPEGVTWQILHALDISGYFTSVVGGDSTEQKKPHPLPLQTVMGQLNVTPHECIMVGDSGVDVEAARAAGVTVVLVPDGYTGVPAESLDADFVLEDLSSLPLEIRSLRAFRSVVPI